MTLDEVARYIQAHKRRELEDEDLMHVYASAIEKGRYFREYMVYRANSAGTPRTYYLILPLDLRIVDVEADLTSGDLNVMIAVMGHREAWHQVLGSL